MEIYDRHSIRLKGYDYSQPGAYFVTICVEKHQSVFGKIIKGSMELNNFGWIAEKYCSITENHFQNVKFDIHITMPNHFHVIINIIDTKIIHHNPVGAGSPRPKTINTTPKFNKTKTNNKYHNINNRHSNFNIVKLNKNDVCSNVNDIHIDVDNAYPNTTNESQNKNNTYSYKNIGKQNVNNTHNCVVNVNRSGSDKNISGDNSNRSCVNTIGRGDLAPTLGQIVGFFKYGVSKHINLIRNTPGTKLWQRNYYEHIIHDKNEYRRISEYIKNNPFKWEMDYFN